MNLSQAVGQKLLLAFHGKDGPSPEFLRALRDYRPAGVTLFRSLNIDNPSQLRALTSSLQEAARELDLPPLLIAIDQEGGQLMAVGDGTPLPGNMALGAAGSEALARRAGELLGCELAALGVNVDYAPCVDVNSNPRNPVVGVRSFGEDPQEVARLGAAMLEGIQSQGVAATAKHFPGHGDTASDSHRGLPIVPHDIERLRQVELPPFKSAVAGGVKLVMSAHVGLPALDGPDAPPATLSANILDGLLRAELGFKGVIVTDAMDMHAIQQGEALGGEAVRAAQAGADLLLLTSDPDDQRRVYEALLQAVQERHLAQVAVRSSAQRVLDLKDWLAVKATTPDLSVIRCAEHIRIANEIAEASITLVRDDTGLLPLRLAPAQRIAVVLPRPLDLTPADTSSYVTPKLAEALRQYHPNVDEFIISYAPTEFEGASLLPLLAGYDLIILGTLNAFDQPEQAAFVRAVLKLGIPAVIAALRLPYDLSAFPEANTYLCTYGLLEPSLQALAKAMFGRTGLKGRLPAGIPGLYPAGFSIQR